ncbi:MAG TPA: methyltransferase domain-containing protein [Kofleriaceae bacterium]|nr:methyltransferase domain-containing protein [Kofleriaceae bacterium]
MNERNPQAKEMADESMVRNLASQADAIWPQELPLMRRYAPRDVLDLGCGTGEITVRMAELFPRARVTGVDLVEAHLERGRTKAAGMSDRVTFQQADAFQLPFASASFDLVVCRHVLQAIPSPERVLAEMVRVARPGAMLHVLAEDYDMIHAAPTRRDVSVLWHGAPRAMNAATGTDLHIGRSIFHHLRALPLTDIEVHYVHVDTQRVPRETFARIIEAWRDGYSEITSKHLGIPEPEARDYFEAMIECIRDPNGFALWVVPIWTARVTSPA